MVLLVIGVCALIAAYIAQNVLIKSIYMKTSTYLKTGKLWPLLAFLGVAFFCTVVVAIVGQGVGAIQDLLSDGIWLFAIFLVSFVALIVLTVRNIRGAGVGLGILLTVLQAVSGVAIFAIGVVAIALRFAGIQLNVANSSKTVPPAWETERAAQKDQWEAERAKAEAWAHHDGFDSLQDAADAGMYDGDPDLLKKD